VLPAALAVAALAAHPGAGKEPAPPCAATVVHYTATRVGTPWLAAGRAFAGHVFYYSAIAGDGRVNQSDGLVAYAGVPGKVLWVPRSPRRAGATLVVTARRLDGDGRFTERLRAVPGRQFPSQLTIPDAGCWRLALRSGRLGAFVVVRAVAPPSAPPCDPTPVFRTVPHPKFGQVTWLQATPRTDGIAAMRFVGTLPGADAAVIYAGGLAPGGWATKFLWWSPHPGTSLTLAGRRVDGIPGRFAQRFGLATADDGTTVFPSIVNIPSAGCWAVTLRTGRTAGLVVFQAVVT